MKCLHCRSGEGQVEERGEDAARAREHGIRGPRAPVAAARRDHRLARQGERHPARHLLPAPAQPLPPLPALRAPDTHGRRTGTAEREFGGRRRNCSATDAWRTSPPAESCDRPRHRFA